MFPIRTLALCAALIAFPAVSQSQTAPPKPESAFAQYKLHSDKNPPANWREVNTLVEKLEGHMGHVRGAPRMMKPEPAPAASATEKPMPSASPAPKAPPSVDHSKHEMKKP